MADRNATPKPESLPKPMLYHAASSYYSMIARYALGLSGIEYESQLLDIHKKREQLQPWYVAINPAMTVPALVCANQSFYSSEEILQYAQTQHPENWVESTAASDQVQTIDELVRQHYQFEVERLTFNVFMQKLPPVRLLFPKLLRKACKELALELAQQPSNPQAIQAKLNLNEQRLAYFSSPLQQRQAQQLELARDLIKRFPNKPTGPWLFGDLPSRADVVLLVFLARLNALGLNNTDLVPRALMDWFAEKTQTQAFVDADVWVKFHIWRLLTHR